MPRINFRDVPSIEAMPAGQYNALFTAYDVKDASKSSNKPFVALTFTIQDEGYENRKVWRNYSLQPQALWALKQTLTRLGAVPEDLESDDVELEDVLQNLIGNACVVDVGVEPYQGTDRNQVRAVLEATGPAF
jgi:hypothetical protein